MIQGLKISQGSDIITRDGVVLGTVDDLKKEHDWLLARVHRLREMLRLAPLMTGKKQREQSKHCEPT